VKHRVSFRWLAGVGRDALRRDAQIRVERTLQRTGGNKQKAANLLGIYRPRLYSKIKKYKIGAEAISQN